MTEIDPVALARGLIQCPSVTPAEGGALDLLQNYLDKIGFQTTRLPFQEPGTEQVDNLYARYGARRPNLCFAGHTDVVPSGDLDKWRADPFAGEIADEYLIGRGAVDMKGAIACFTAAAARFAARHGADFGGSISLLITGDEEGPAINGTRKVLQWLKRKGEPLDACLIGEPTNPTRLGEVIKIGRRGSLNATLTVQGTQGHTAYPHLADNAVERLVRMANALMAEPLDRGTAHFQPSTLAFSSIDVGNKAANVIPATATAQFNIRFNDAHTAASLERWIRDRCDDVGGAYVLAIQRSGDSFLTPPGPLSGVIAAAVEAVTGLTPALTTSGGTSDARFIKDFCPVAEFGLVGQTMHMIDERVSLADISQLTDIYHRILAGYFECA